MVHRSPCARMDYRLKLALFRCRQNHKVIEYPVSFHVCVWNSNKPYDTITMALREAAKKVPPQVVRPIRAGVGVRVWGGGGKVYELKKSFDDHLA